LLHFSTLNDKGVDMKKTKWVPVFALFIVLVWIGGGFTATEEESPSSPIDQKAMAILMKMADFLSQAKTFEVTLDTGYDVVQQNGQKVEFGAVRKMVVDRPNRQRVDIEQRDGSKAEFIFNGKEIYIYNALDNVYGTIEKSGTIDQAVKYFTEELQMRYPLAELFSTSLPEFLKQIVNEINYVDAAAIDGVNCDHLAARSDDVDFQVGIEKGNKPILHRIIITYKNEEAEPQFWGQFRNWNFAPKISDSLFAIHPPKDAEQISFVALVRQKSNSGEQKGE
jgi:hypothetical protein